MVGMRPVRFTSTSVAVALLASLLGSPARAQMPEERKQDANGSGPKEDEKPFIAPNGVQTPSIATSLPPELGGAVGLRQALADRGVQFGLNYIGEGLANVTGGVRPGSTYFGRLEATLDADLEKALGAKDLTFHANAFQIHGRGLSRFFIGNILPVSAIEATPSTRLFELWLERKALNGKASVRLGQLGADQEFFTAYWDNIFINGTFGWPGITTLNLPSGGPAYPLAALGVRVKIDPTPNISLLAAVFDGDPAGPASPFQDVDPQRRNGAGLNFRLRDPPFVIAEAQGRYEIGGVSGTAKIGAWRHFGRFNDQRLASDFLTIANPASAGTPLQRRGDYGIYGVIDQQIFRPPSGEPDKGVGFSIRASVSPQQDRNIISAYVDGGLNFTGMVPGRANDAFGFAGAYARFSRSIRRLDQDVDVLTGRPAPIRSAEAILEATYQAQVVDGFNVQPVMQYVIRPAGGVANPGDPLGVRPLRNAFMVGARTTIRY